MSKHKEITFETEITNYLTHHDWIEGTSSGYDQELALYPKVLIAYIKSNQAITLLKERRTALISAAVTGKIKVNDEVRENTLGCDVRGEVA